MNILQSEALTVARLEIFVFRAPIAIPVRTSFGVMTDRPAVLVRLEDHDGNCGWGEAWCNFPTCGAEHRARLLQTVVAPLLVKQSFASPQAAFAYLTERLHILTLQAHEPGPLAQAVAAVDIALWDMQARKAGQPLHRVLGGTGDGTVPVYASGINPTGMLEIVEKSRAQHYRAFKFKVGFNREQDLHNIRAAQKAAQPGEIFAIDANQAWDLPTALSMTAAMADAPLAWLEEPLPCDTHISQWQILAQHCTIPLSAGENIRTKVDFRTAMDSGAIAILQPDMCKWGGVTLCHWVATQALQAGLRYCPHYLGAGIGLLASAHLLAAVGGDGLMEVDVNDNPLRELLAEPFPKIHQGRMQLSEDPGLGVEPDLARAREFMTEHWELS